MHSRGFNAGNRRNVTGLMAFMVCAILCGILSTTALAAETYSLAPKRQVGELSNVEVVMEVGGDLLLSTPGKATAIEASIRKVPMSVAAKLVYDEQWLTLRKSDKEASRATRFYKSAKALVTVDKGEQKPVLGDDHRLIAVEATENDTTLYCPSKTLSREELDLIDIAGNTLILDEFLPSQPVALGGSWKHSDQLLASLLRLDAVSLADAQSMLTEVDAKQQLAKVSLAGTVQGAVGGVATEIELKAKYTFDMQSQRITVFALLIKEKRSIGHVGPGLDVVAKQIIKVTPIRESADLTNAAASLKSQVASETEKQLHFESTQGRFALDHERRWFVTDEEKKLTVFRFVDRGELVAQCNLTPLDPTPAGQAFTLADFQKDIEKTLGKKFGQFESAKEETDKLGRRVFRVVASGTVSELPIQWVYYLLTTPSGQRLSVGFTMESTLAERFGQADRQFVSALEIAPPQTASTGTPTPAKR